MLIMSDLDMRIFLDDVDVCFLRNHKGHAHEFCQFYEKNEIGRGGGDGFDQFHHQDRVVFC